MIPVADLLRRISNVAQDDEYIRWTLEERIDWINDAATATVIHRPSANVITSFIGLREGALQSIPHALEGSNIEVIELLDVIANSDGTPVDRTERYLLDSQVPGWRASKKRDQVRHFTFDDRSPKTFYVYPPVNEGTSVEIMMSFAPPKVEFEDGALEIGREYIPAIVNYVLYRMFSKDSEYADGQVAMLHYQAFAQALGIQNQSAVAVSPNQGEP